MVMRVRRQRANARVFRWDIWWRWALASLIGIIVAHGVYQALPRVLHFPLDDEDIWLIQSWRVAVLTCVYYTPLSLAQWLVLRRSAARSWWWIIITLGSVVILYPGSIWALWTLQQWDLASDIWFFGVGGGSVYLVAQWVAMLRWAHNRRVWGLWLAATTVGWFCVLSVNAYLNADRVVRVGAEDLGELVRGMVLSWLYQLTLGGALAAILTPDPLSEMTQTAVAVDEGS